MVYQKLTRLLAPRIGLYFGVMLAFAGVTALLGETQAAVAEANCGDHTCVRTGKISREGEVIVCLPHRLTVEIQGGAPAGFDAAVG